MRPLKNSSQGEVTVVETELQEMLDRVADGSGYGDPDARLNDDRRTQILIAQQQVKMSQQQSEVAQRLNRITLLIVLVGALNVVVMAIQVWRG